MGGALDHQGAGLSVREREHLLLKAQTGDPEALNTLFESCRRRLYLRALQILARPQDAEDAVQEAMVAAYTHLQQFERRADFLTWTTRIVINAALQHIRKTRTKPTVSWDQVDSECKDRSFMECLKDSQPTPEQRLQRLEHRELLEHALHKLPVASRRAIQLCKFADYSVKDAASTLGLSTSTVKTRLHRGRRALMVHIQRKTEGWGKPVNKERSCGFVRLPNEQCARG
jgi:RNA polymerase sigma-70 factor, ECF subfamily